MSEVVSSHPWAPVNLRGPIQDQSITEGNSGRSEIGVFSCETGDYIHLLRGDLTDYYAATYPFLILISCQCP